MSFIDNDKFKDKKKKKVLHNKDREGHDSEASTSSVKQPIILAKPERETPQASDKSSSLLTYTIKARDPDSRAVSPSVQKTTSVLARKESDTTALTPAYQLATKPSTAIAEDKSPSHPLQLPPSMPSCVKLVDDSLQMCEGVLEFLTDQTDFVVVGVLGEHNVGKSYLMSALAGKSDLFRSHPEELYDACGHCTSGIDAYVTSSRVLFLDTQPMMASAILDCMGMVSSSMDKKLAGELAPSSSENATELQSLQIASFLLAVCHVVIVVQDWTFSIEMIRCLMDAEMLKPTTPTTSGDDQIIEYFPNVIFLKNCATASEFTAENVSRVQEMLSVTIEGTRLHVDSGLSIGANSLMSHLLTKSSHRSLNYFLLPLDDDHDESETFRGHPGFNELVQILRHQILSAPHQLLTTSPISEKHWFHYASKALENIKKSSLFMEFSRFLP